jgi:hypothetical protein
MSAKMKSIVVLLVVLAIILAVNPNIINNIYDTILGRLVLIGIVIFLSMNNVTLGLISALVVILASNQYGLLVEGMDNNTGISASGISGISASSKSPDKKPAPEVPGVDQNDIHQLTIPKDSKQLPVDPNMNKSNEVNASSPDTLKPASKLEGFILPGGN